jgi:pimeloyl-ACP methyl ester carboxylesterase
MSNKIRLGEETEFTIFGRKIAAKRWGDSGGYPTLAIHGWLDNANTFDRLAPMLPELDLVVIDLAGHGHSDHRAPGVQYLQWDYVVDILALADLLGWDTFNIIGHSMGGQISSVIAATFPERVNKAIMIDGFAAEGTYTDEERVAGNRQTAEKMLSAHTRPAKVFQDIETMALRVKEATDQTLDAARILVNRGHREVNGGVSWRTDPRIRYPSSNRSSRNQLDIMLKQSTSPALLIVAEEGEKWYQSEIPHAELHHPNLKVIRIPGPHHIHLEANYAGQVIALTRDFLNLAMLGASNDASNHPRKQSQALSA